MKTPQKLTDVQWQSIAGEYKSGCTTKAIAERYDVSPACVVKNLKKRGVEFRKGAIHAARACVRCGSEFTPSNGSARYCGSKATKTGCSYQRYQERMRLLNARPDRRAQMNESAERWRLANPDRVRERQREARRKQGASPRVLHGHAASGSRKASPTYSTWIAMLDRCRDPKSKDYARYGSVGITVCERWLDFRVFLDDMGERPSVEHSIDRKDPRGNYEPGNCRWATHKQQNRNRSFNHLLEFNGEQLCVADWAERLGFPAQALYARLRASWSVERALTEPMRKNSRRKS